jgi:DNA-binding MarR family transcriptional regulator
MAAAERLDLLLHGFLSRFFAIPARQPATGVVTFAQMRVLWTLEPIQPATPGRIAAALGIGSSAATEIVERLARAGYIQRAHSERDRRHVLLRLSPKGRRLVEGFRVNRQSRLRKLLSTLEGGDVRRMSKALQTLNDIVGRWKGA